MLQIMYCKQCESSTIPVGGVSVTVELHASEHCDKCYHSHQRKRPYFFCSPACLVQYIETNKEAFLENAANFGKLESFPWKYEKGDDNVTRSVNIEK